MADTIRIATAADIPHLVTHRVEMFRDMGIPCRHDELRGRYAEWLTTALAVGTYRAWVAEADGVVVAGAGAIIYPWAPGPVVMDSRMVFVFNVYTAPQHRGRGLARRLMEAIHAWCRDQGIERLALNASPAGLPLYASMGYEVYAEPMMRLSLE